MLAITTGMRMGELLALRWQDIHLADDSLCARSTLTIEHGVAHFSEPKTASSRRRITLSVLATEALQRHHTLQEEARTARGDGWTDLDLVFPNSLGKPMDGKDLLRTKFLPLLQRAGLPRIRFHDLRHTAATLLLSRGVHLKVVSEMLGHSTIAITLDIYSHVVPHMQQQAASVMDDLLKPR